MSARASGISGYLVKLRIAMPNTVAFFFLAAIPFLHHPAKPAPPAPVLVKRLPAGMTSSRIQPLRVQLSQHREFRLARWLGGRHVVVEQQCEAGVVAHFLPRHALVHGKYLHLTGLSIETHDGQISYDPPHPPLGKTCAIARAVALDPTGRRDEIHVPHEASLLVLHGDD